MSEGTAVPAESVGAAVKRLDGRVAIVSGAASGIGRSIACRLAMDGAKVVCGDLQRDPVSGSVGGGEATDREIVSRGGDAAFVQWDITDQDQTAEAMASARDTFGRLDIVVANAGAAIGGEPLPDEQLDTWERQLGINLTGTFNTVRLGLKHLVDQHDGGRIVIMSSTAALVGIAGIDSAYGVSKAGLLQLMRQAAVEGASHGITANAVCPGYVRTALNRAAWEDSEVNERLVSMHPLGRLGEPSDVAAAVSFFASPDAAWVTGAVLPVDGGMTLS